MAARNLVSGCHDDRVGMERLWMFWSAFVLGSAAAHVIACGGSTASEAGSETRTDGASRVNETSTYDQLCSVGSGCVGDAEDATNGSDRHDAEAENDAAISSDGSLLCGYHEGPVAPGADAVGPAIQCTAGWACVTLNGAWACCTLEGPGGASMCIQPFVTDGG